MRRPIPGAPQATPLECDSKTVLEPLIVPSWIFVMNFDVVNGAPPNQEPVGCIRVYRTPSPDPPADFISVPCKTQGDVSYSGGVASFHGGFVLCEVNIRSALMALSPPITLTGVAQYPYYELIGLGVLRVPVPVEPYGNPVVYYEPYTSTVPGNGLFLTPQSADSFVMTSVFNNVTNTGTSVFSAGPTARQYIVRHNGSSGTYTVSHEVEGKVIDTFSPRKPVSFWTDGGAFWFGGSPFGPPLAGDFDEIIVDPPDGGRPPYAAYVPLLIASRQDQ